MNNQHTAAIPNTLIETMFYESIKNYDDVLTYRNLVAKGSIQAIASATSLVASGFSFGDVNFSFSGILIDSEENIF